MDQLPPELVGKAIQDAEFRKRLLADPATVAATEGFLLTEDQIHGLESLDAEAVDAAIDAMVGDLATSKWG